MATKKELEATRIKAQVLFLDTNKTQKEIAKALNISPQTLSSWVNSGGWKAQRLKIKADSINDDIFIAEQKDLLRQNVANRNKKGGVINSAEADTLRKLKKDQEKDVPIKVMVKVGTLFFNFLAPINLEKAQEFSALYDQFINSIPV